MIGQYCVDANIFIASWYSSYPIKNFPSLWVQLAQYQDDIILIAPINGEIEPISSADKNLSLVEQKTKYPLRTWLNTNQFSETPIDDTVNQLSLELEKKYQIKNPPKGVGKNDILLIAYAKIMEKTVVTFEKIQNQRPHEKHNYKIPLVCKDEKVICIDFINMIDALGVRI